MNSHLYLTIINEDDEKEIPTIDKNKIEQFKKDLEKYNNKGETSTMPNSQVINLLFHIANNIDKIADNEEDAEVYIQAIEIAINKLKEEVE